MSQIGGPILWSSLQSLDIAIQLKTTGFKNLDIVSSELVSFYWLIPGMNPFNVWNHKRQN